MAAEVAIAPYLYEVLWKMALYGPMTAAKIADEHNLPGCPSYLHWNGRDAANRLRGAERLGLVDRDEEGRWMLTERGMAWMACRELGS